MRAALSASHSADVLTLLALALWTPRCCGLRRHAAFRRRLARCLFGSRVDTVVGKAAMLLLVILPGGSAPLYDDPLVSLTTPGNGTPAEALVSLVVTARNVLVGASLAVLTRLPARSLSARRDRQLSGAMTAAGIARCRLAGLCARQADRLATACVDIAPRGAATSCTASHGTCWTAFKTEDG